MSVEEESFSCSEPVNHWLYEIIPRHRGLLSLKRPWECLFWALCGNDDDGIFGEAEHAGQEWQQRWRGAGCSLQRFVWWQIRNPLHNLTFYVLGFADQDPKPPLLQLGLLSTKELRGVRWMEDRDVFPMKDNTGIYAALFVAKRFVYPFVSVRLNLFQWKLLEGYAGWRERGNFGLALRLKSALFA